MTNPPLKYHDDVVIIVAIIDSVMLWLITAWMRAVLMPTSAPRPKRYPGRPPREYDREKKISGYYGRRKQPARTRTNTPPRTVSKTGARVVEDAGAVDALEEALGGVLVLSNDGVCVRARVLVDMLTGFTHQGKKKRKEKKKDINE